MPFAANQRTKCVVVLLNLNDLLSAFVVYMSEMCKEKNGAGTVFSALITSLFKINRLPYNA